MARRGAGSIINISSMAGRIWPASRGIRGAKAALDSMTQSWTAEYEPTRGARKRPSPLAIVTRPEARARYDKLVPPTALHRAHNRRRLPKSSPSLHSTSELRHRRQCCG